jgi:hypothetical protein
MIRVALVVTAVMAGSVAVLAQHPQGGHQKQVAPAQPYAGQDTRAVAMLSAEEVQGFLAGRGMGLARSGEVNGYPGPMHVLELREQLQLSPEQGAQVQSVFDVMKAKAVALGQRYVDAEKAVDVAFKANAPASEIEARVTVANRLLGEIRMAHLEAHLAVTPVLSLAQRTKYAELRGYSGASHDLAKHKH